VSNVWAFSPDDREIMLFSHIAYNHAPEFTLVEIADTLVFVQHGKLSGQCHSKERYILETLYVTMISDSGTIEYAVTTC
jgi:hypothetical protein